MDPASSTPSADGATTDPLLRRLVSQVTSRRCVLFIGAGLSLECRDADGRTGLLAGDLADEIGHKFLGPYKPGRSLAAVADFAISASSRPEVDQFIQERLGGLQPTPSILKLPLMPWKGIYTTNYDCVIEKAYAETKDRALELHPVYTNRTLISSLKSNEVPFYKLHGCVTRIDYDEGTLVLTGQDLAKARTLRRRLFSRLQEDMTEYTILYAGYARQDPHFEEIVGELLEELGGVTNVPRSYALAPGFEPYEQAHWETKKVTLIDMTAEQFFPWLYDQLSYATSSSHIVQSNLSAILPAGTTVAPETAAIICRHYEIVSEELSKGASDFIDFFKGDQPSWGTMSVGCDMRRQITDDILLETVQNEAIKGLQIVLIRAEAGSGKSTLLRRVGVDLTIQWEKPVLFLRHSSRLQFESIEPILRLVNQRLYILLDNASDHVWELSEFAARIRRSAANITVIAAARANEWADRAVQVPLPELQTYDLGPLTEGEINGLLAKLQQFGQLGALAAMQPDEQRRALRDRAERQLLVALREVTEGKGFEDIIRDEYNTIPSEEAINAYLYICAVYQSRVALRAGVLRRLTDIPFDEFSDRLLRPSDRVIVVDEDDYGVRYRARHPIIAQIITQYRLPDARDRLRVYEGILRLLDIGFEEDQMAFRRVSRSRNLVSSLGLQDLKNRFY